MKNWRLGLSLALGLALSMVLLCGTALAAEAGKGTVHITNNGWQITYKLDKGELFSCFPVGEDADRISHLVIPSHVEGAAITSIGYNAFKSCRGLTKITPPSGLLTIGEMGFSGCPDLEEIILPDGLLTIGVRAFKSLFKIF